MMISHARGKHVHGERYESTQMRALMIIAFLLTSIQSIQSDLIIALKFNNNSFSFMKIMLKQQW
jgi:hypothetical protein